MRKRYKIVLSILLPIICITSICLCFLLHKNNSESKNHNEQQITAEDTGVSIAEKSKKGGAIYIESGATYTMKDGTIAGKDNVYGGAVYVTNGATFIMEGGTITGCQARYGGAVYVEKGGTCNIKGGTISNCSAEHGFAIFCETGAIVNSSENAVLTNNNFGLYDMCINYYVDGAFSKSVEIKTAVADFSDAPLDLNNCCGYYINSGLTQSVHEGDEIYLAGSNVEEKPVFDKYGELNLYTKTATLEKLTFIQRTSSCEVLAKDSDISGEVVLPYNYKNLPIIFSTSGTFKDCTSITSVVVPGSVKIIEQYACAGCTSLSNVVMPNTITELQWNAFSDCTSLKNIELPNSLTTIHGQCFEKSGLTEVTIPASVTFLKQYATFQNCKSLTRAVFEEGSSLTQIGGHCFANTKLANIELPSSIKILGVQVFYGCTELTSVSLHDGITTMGASIFGGCSNLTYIKLPDNLTLIPEYAFSGCNKLKTVVLPSKLETIDSYAFYWCSALSGSITLPSTLKKIGVKGLRGVGWSSISFTNTSGWYYTSSEDYTGGTELSSAELSVSSTLTKYLKETYIDYYWYRSE